ncbi:MAG TPA: AsmA-like C-terminal region-containing protein [Candidatus Binataceae bacterium]
MMRRALLITGVAAAVVILIGAVLVGYAFFNLSSLVARNQKRILARISDALGRRVEIAHVQARAGWGVSVQITGLKVADDPAFSQLPFLVADEVSMNVEFLPLLRGEARVSKLDLMAPDIRIVRNARGDLNLGTLGAAPGAPRTSAEARKANSSRLRSSLADLQISALSVDDGAVYFTDLSEQGKPVQLRHVDFDVANFSAAAPFDVNLKLAFPGKQQNVEVSGTVGPLLKQGVLDTADLPLEVKFNLDSLLLERFRALAIAGGAVPAALSILDPISLNGTISGSLNDIVFQVSTDLTTDRVTYAELFNKPDGAAAALEATGSLKKQNQLELARLDVKLGDLDLIASKVSLGGAQGVSAQLDSNSFDLANLSPIVTPMTPYAATGASEIHGVARLVNGRPEFGGTLTLKQVALTLGPAFHNRISNVSGSILLTERSQIIIEPTDFMLGQAHANVEGRIESLSPLNANYTLKADSVRLFDLSLSRPRDEVVNQLAVSGSAGGEISAPDLSAKINSSDGSVANVAYRNLDLTAAYRDGRLSLRRLNMDVFGGSLSTDTDALLGATPNFDVALRMKNINVEQALSSQQIDAAKTVRGFLTGNLAASGSGDSWNQIKPTLRGNGQLALVNGKLIGVNIVADAINAVASAPGVSQVLDVAFMSSHRGVLVDPNTELNSVTMSFRLVGPRLTTNDVVVNSPDYGISGNGWFDMDKNVSMNIDINLSFGLQFAIPVIVTGKLPAVLVLPDLPRLTARVAMGAISTPGRIIQGGINAAGSLVGGGSSSGSKPLSIPNPLNSIKKWLP